MVQEELPVDLSQSSETCIAGGWKCFPPNSLPFHLMWMEMKRMEIEQMMRMKRMRMEIGEKMRMKRMEMKIVITIHRKEMHPRCSLVRPSLNF